MINVTIEEWCHALVVEAARIRDESIISFISRVAGEAANEVIEAEEDRLRAIREKQWPKADPKE